MAPGHPLSIPNLLSLARLLGVPLLFVLVRVEPVGWFVAAYAALGLTDWLDGRLARAWQQVTPLGSTLDSVADLAYYVSTAWFAWQLFPGYVQPNLPYLVACLALYPVLLLVGRWRAGRVVLPHTHLSRVAGVVVVVVMLASFFVDTTLWLRATILLYAAGFAEQVAMVGLYGAIAPDTRTILALWEPRKRRAT
jgi:phosphatidylglycerophosphate synthase